LSISVLVLVLLAAITHALWNTWLKISGDRLIALATLAIGWTIVGLLSLPIVGIPGRDAWPYLLVSTFIHLSYSLTLIRAYGLADLSVTYPIARGIAPLVVTVAAVIFLDEPLGRLGFFAVCLVVIGVVWIGLPAKGQRRSGLVISLITGCLIGTYTFLDGLGGQVGGSPHAYTASLLLTTSIPLFIVTGCVHRGDCMRLARPIWAKGMAAGVLSAIAFGIVIWAMSVAPMSLVAAVRESSVVFVALLGSVLLKERVRWVAVIFVFSGIFLARLA
jgi:drug/metabolite transporter (DMT)-like permease